MKKIDNPDHDSSGRSRLLSNVLTSWLSQLFTIITGFFLPRVIDQELGQQMLGIWDLSWAIVAYVTLSDLGIGSSLNRFVAQYRASDQSEKLRVATSTVSAMQIGLGLLVAIIVSAITVLLPRLYPGLGPDIVEAQKVFFLLGMSVCFRFGFDTSRGVLTGCHRWDIYNAIYGGMFLSCSLAMLAAILSGYSLAVASAIYLIATVVEGVLRTVVASKICADASFAPTSVSLRFAREILGFGISAIALAITPILVLQTANVTIAALLGASALAIFARPMAILRFIRAVISKYTYILTPMASSIAENEGNEALATFVIENTRYGLAIILPLITLYCIHGDQVIAVWMDQSYVNETLIITLGIGELLAFGQSPILRVMIGVNLHGPIAKISLLVGLIALLTGFFTVTYFGPSLELYALLVASTLGMLNGVLIPLYSCRKLGISIHRYISEAIFPVLGLWSIVTVPFIFWTVSVKDDFAQAALQGSMYAAALLIIYWHYIVPDSLKSTLMRYLFNR